MAYPLKQIFLGIILDVREQERQQKPKAQKETCQEKDTRVYEFEMGVEFDHTQSRWISIVLFSASTVMREVVPRWASISLRNVTNTFNSKNSRECEVV